MSQTPAATVDESVAATERFIQTAQQTGCTEEMMQRVIQVVKDRMDSITKETHRLLDLLGDVVVATNAAANPVGSNATKSLNILRINTSVQMCVDAVENLLVSVNLLRQDAVAEGSSVNSCLNKSSVEGSITVNALAADPLTNIKRPAVKRGRPLKKKNIVNSTASNAYSSIKRTRTQTVYLSHVTATSSLNKNNKPNKNTLSSSGDKETVTLDSVKTGKKSKALFCSCRAVSYGNMIMCDSPSCKPKWFHFKCVHLQSAPKGKWYCPGCKSKMPNVKTRTHVRAYKKSKLVPTVAASIKDDVSALQDIQKEQSCIQTKIASSSREENVVTKLDGNELAATSKSKKILKGARNGKLNNVQVDSSCISGENIASSAIEKETVVISAEGGNEGGNPKNNESIDVCQVFESGTADQKVQGFIRRRE